MEKFADLFRKERLKSGKKFREIANLVGKSIGYLSDIEAGRRNPPELSVIEKIEQLFGIEDGRLIKSAKKERANLTTGISYLIQAKPELQELLLRADTLPDDQFKEVLIYVKKLTADSEDSDFNLYLNEANKLYFDGRYY